MYQLIPAPPISTAAHSANSPLNPLFSSKSLKTQLKSIRKSPKKSTQTNETTKKMSRQQQKQNAGYSDNHNNEITPNFKFIQFHRVLIPSRTEANHSALESQLSADQGNNSDSDSEESADATHPFLKMNWSDEQNQNGNNNEQIVLIQHNEKEKEMDEEKTNGIEENKPAEETKKEEERKYFTPSNWSQPEAAIELAEKNSIGIGMQKQNQKQKQKHLLMDIPENLLLNSTQTNTINNDFNNNSMNNQSNINGLANGGNRLNESYTNINNQWINTTIPYSNSNDNNTRIKDYSIPLHVDSLPRKRQFRSIGHGKHIPLNNSLYISHSKNPNILLDVEHKNRNDPQSISIHGHQLLNHAKTLKLNENQSAITPRPPATRRPSSQAATQRQPVSQSSYENQLNQANSNDLLSSSTNTSNSSSNSTSSSFHRYMSECRAKRAQCEQLKSVENTNAPSQSSSSCSSSASSSSSASGSAARCFSHRVPTPLSYEWNNPNLSLYTLPSRLLTELLASNSIELPLTRHVRASLPNLESAVRKVNLSDTINNSNDNIDSDDNSKKNSNSNNNSNSHLKNNNHNRNTFNATEFHSILPRQLDKNEYSQQRAFHSPLTLFISRAAGIPSNWINIKNEPKLVGSQREYNIKYNTNKKNNNHNIPTPHYNPLFPDSSYLLSNHYDTSFHLSYPSYSNELIYSMNNPELHNRKYFRIIHGDKRDIEQKIIRKLIGLDRNSTKHTAFR